MIRKHSEIEKEAQDSELEGWHREAHHPPGLGFKMKRYKKAERRKEEPSLPQILPKEHSSPPVLVKIVITNT